MHGNFIAHSFESINTHLMENKNNNNEKNSNRSSSIILIIVSGIALFFGIQYFRHTTLISQSELYMAYQDTVIKNREMIKNSDACMRYLQLLKNNRKMKIMSKEDTRTHENCTTTLAYAINYYLYKTSTCAASDASKEPVAFRIPNTELSELINSGADSTILVLGKRSVGGYMTTCPILFPMDNATRRRNTSYTNQTHETFPVHKYLNQVGMGADIFSELFSCQ
jgi:hypothetical protein